MEDPSLLREFLDNWRLARRWSIQRFADEVGVSDAIPHRFRHLFATIYLTKYPGDEIGLRRIMGHLSKDTLAEYVHLAGAEIARRAGQASPATAWLKEQA